MSYCRQQQEFLSFITNAFVEALDVQHGRRIVALIPSSWPRAFLRSKVVELFLRDSCVAASSVSYGEAHYKGRIPVYCLSQIKPMLQMPRAVLSHPTLLNIYRDADMSQLSQNALHIDLRSLTLSPAY